MEMPRLLLVGQAPARSATPDMRPWDSRSCDLLARRMGWTDRQDVLKRFATTNLNQTLVGTKGKYDLFDEDEAVARAEDLRRSWWDYDLVLAAGQRVARLLGAPLLEWKLAEDMAAGDVPIIGGIPHPGGTNRWWNKAENRTRGEAFLWKLGRAIDSDDLASLVA